jgi:hypothetical protein
MFPTHTPNKRVSVPRTTVHAIIITTTHKHIAGHTYIYIINILQRARWRWLNVKILLRIIRPGCRYYHTLRNSRCTYNTCNNNIRTINDHNKLLGYYFVYNPRFLWSERPSFGSPLFFFFFFILFSLLFYYLAICSVYILLAPCLRFPFHTATTVTSTVTTVTAGKHRCNIAMLWHRPRDE